MFVGLMPITPLNRFGCSATTSAIRSIGFSKWMSDPDHPPVVDFERAVAEIEQHGFKEEVKKKLFWENAIRVYGLEDWV
jgi:hypothetical protein